MHAGSRVQDAGCRMQGEATLSLSLSLSLSLNLSLSQSLSLSTSLSLSLLHTRARVGVQGTLSIDRCTQASALVWALALHEAAPNMKRTSGSKQQAKKKRGKGKKHRGKDGRNLFCRCVLGQILEEENGMWRNDSRMRWQRGSALRRRPIPRRSPARRRPPTHGGSSGGRSTHPGGGTAPPGRTPLRL
jgi:hypothetical protein